jgi:glyine---[glycyl-carrier protein] ligase
MAAEINIAGRVSLDGESSERLAERVDHVDASSRRPLPGRSTHLTEIPLSFAQRCLWSRAQRSASSSRSAYAAALRLTGALDHPALEVALSDVVERHEILRSVFRTTFSGPRQVILDTPTRLQLTPAPVAHADLSGAITAASERGFDLSTEFPLRAHLFSMGTSEHVLLLVFHHIAGDRWSMMLLMRDLARAYARRCSRSGEGPLPLPLQYADYALQQHELLGSEDDPDSAITRQLSFWTDALADLPERINLPIDRSRTAVSCGRTGSVSLRFEASLLLRMQMLAQDSDVDWLVVVQAGLAALLTRLGAGSDIPLGNCVAGRRDGNLSDVIGCFANTVVLRTNTSGNPSFRDLVTRARSTFLAACGHQDLPFERLTEVLNRANARGPTPLVQVMLAFNNTPELSLDLPGLTATFEWVEPLATTYELCFVLPAPGRSAETSEGINGTLEYSTDLFDDRTAQTITDRLVRLLEAAVLDPDQSIGQLDILAPSERKMILYDWNDTARLCPNLTLPELFEAQVDKSLDGTALVCGDQSLSYAELNARANQLGHYLRSQGVGPEVVVGLCVERSLEMIVAIIGILKAGGAYLPLDPTYPQERLAFMMEDAQPHLLLTQVHLVETMPPNAIQTFCLDRDWRVLSHYPTANLAHPGSPDNLAYVIYTSGSTGKPKGILTLHRNVVHFAQNQIYASW